MFHMKPFIHIFYILLISSLLFTACESDSSFYTQEEVNHKVDSIMKIKSKELLKEAKEDRDLRFPIVIKELLDTSLRHRQKQEPEVPMLESEASWDDPQTDLPEDTTVPTRP